MMIKNNLCAFLLCTSLLLTSSKNLKAFELSFPLQCSIGEDCFIASYVDLFYTKEQKDYLCREHMTVNNNKGVKIRIRDVSAMENGIPVYAAASGMVIRKRDGIDDKLVTSDTEAKEVQSIAHGNVIIIEHDDGYKTIYSHLAKDSINFELGDEVKRGDKIAKMGMSGFTKYPHLHFAVTYNDQPIDPFSGSKQNNECAASTSEALWEQKITDAFKRYRDTHILKTGFAKEDPKTHEILYGNYDTETLNDLTEKLVFWSYTQALEKNDRIVLSLFDPEGNLIDYKKNTLEKSYPQHIGYVGRKISKGNEFNFQGIPIEIRCGNLRIC